MRLGVMMPLGDVGGAPATLKEFALAAEAIGYTNLGLPDHVLGDNPATADAPAEQRTLSPASTTTPSWPSGTWRGCAGRRRSSRPRC